MVDFGFEIYNASINYYFIVVYLKDIELQLKYVFFIDPAL